jgi:hypothetical protein
MIWRKSNADVTSRPLKKFIMLPPDWTAKSVMLN